MTAGTRSGRSSQEGVDVARLSIPYDVPFGNSRRRLEAQST